MFEAGAPEEAGGGHKGESQGQRAGEGGPIQPAGWLSITNKNDVPIARPEKPTTAFLRGKGTLILCHAKHYYW